ncbi:MAG: hypothetical protein JSU04_04115 [Bdellovibrionales bacterium]|nr:hypothetical protein [Bdellovibrionales bacterium]
MRFLLNLFRFRTQNPGFFYFREQVAYERQMENVRTDPYYRFNKAG